MPSLSSAFSLSVVINLHNGNPTANFPRRPIDPHNPTRAHPLIQGDASSKADDVKQVGHVRRLPRHLLIECHETSSGPVEGR